MGKIILCMGDTAKTPYFLKGLDISVYTVEELCWCIRENTFLMDQDMACRELADWLEEECGRGELAGILRGILRAGRSAGAFFVAILNYTGFYPHREIERIGHFLEEGEGQSGPQRQKNVADYLAGNRKYELALLRYQKILRENPGEDASFRAALLHNAGYVCARLFLFEQAATFFGQAFALSGAKESYMQYLAAKRLALDEKEYVDFIVGEPGERRQISMDLEKRIEQMAVQWKESAPAAEVAKLRALEKDWERAEALEETVGQIKETYRDMVREK